MEYDFDYVVKRTHLHAIGSGTRCVENIRRFFVETEQVRREHQLDGVLCELRFTGPGLDLGTLYSMMVENRAGASLVKRIACVDASLEHLSDRTEFIELASIRLGVNFRVFPAIADAERWLRG